jgi:hypothetical protein
VCGSLPGTRSTSRQDFTCECIPYTPEKESEEDSQSLRKWWAGKGRRQKGTYRREGREELSLGVLSNGAGEEGAQVGVGRLAQGVEGDDGKGRNGGGQEDEEGEVEAAERQADGHEGEVVEGAVEEPIEEGEEDEHDQAFAAPGQGFVVAGERRKGVKEGGRAGGRAWV